MNSSQEIVMSKTSQNCNNGSVKSQVDLPEGKKKKIEKI